MAYTQGNAVNSIPEGFTHSLRSAVIRAKKSNKVGDELKPTSFYQGLVDHFFEKQSSHLFFWNTVCENYHQKKWHGETDRDVIEEVRSGEVYSLVHTIESMVFNRRPKLFLDGWHGHVQSEMVPVLESMLNNEWYKDYRLVKEVRLAVRDCIKTGWGAVISSYDADFDGEEMREEGDENANLSAENPFVAAALNEAGDQQAAILSQMAEEAPRETVEQDSRVLMDQINTRRISAFDLIIDPAATCVEDAKWLGRRLYKTVDAIANDELLSNNKNVAPTSEMKQAIRGKRKKQDQAKDPYRYVELYEIWERLLGGGWRYILIGRDHPKPLRVVDNPLFIGCPIRVLRWNEDGEEVFAQSDILPAWGAILAKRLSMTKALDGYSREHLDTTFIDANSGITEESLKGIGDPTIGKYVIVKGTNTNGRLADMFYKPQKDPKSPEVMNFLAILEREVQSATGIGANQQGQALKSATSATEANEIASFARAKGEHKFGACEEFVSAIATDRLGLMWQFYEKHRVARIAGLEASKAWPTRENRMPGAVQCGLYVRVDPGSLRPVDDQVRVQQKIQALQIVGQIPGAIQMVNMQVFLRELFRDLGFKDGTAILYSAEQMAMMAQMQALMQQMQASSGGGAPGGQANPGDTESSGKPTKTPKTSGEVSQQQRGGAGGGVAA